MTTGLLCSTLSPPALLPPHPALPSTPAQLLVVRGKCSYPGTSEWIVVSPASSRCRGVIATLCPLRGALGRVLSHWKQGIKAGGDSPFLFPGQKRARLATISFLPESAGLGEQGQSWVCASCGWAETFQ